jgi:predicted PhzF superfamily epimerase YddE/YHI9
VLQYGVTELPDVLARSVVLDVLHVFCGPDDRYGNKLGVVRDGAAVRAVGDRQALAARLGYSETVFIDDPERGIVDIFTPSCPLPFAAHPLIGTAWLLDLDVLVTPVGEVYGCHDGEFTWITARAEWVPPRTLRQYASPEEVDALPAPPYGEDGLYAWAWEDEAASRVRARAFCRRGDNSVEDEATGAAALLLTHQLDRALNIIQGQGSQILTAPGRDGEIEIGGRVRLTQQAPPTPVRARIPMDWAGTVRLASRKIPW